MAPAMTNDFYNLPLFNLKHTRNYGLLHGLLIPQRLLERSKTQGSEHEVYILHRFYSQGLLHAVL